jgi:hypothetical protein
MGRRALSPPKKLKPEVALARFLECATTDVGDMGHVEPTLHLLAAFGRWCSQEHVDPMGPVTFGRELGKTGEFEPILIGESWGKRRRAWKDIRLRPRFKQIAEEAEERSKPPAPSPAARRLRRMKPEFLVRKFLVWSTLREEGAVETFALLFQAHLEWCKVFERWPLSCKEFGRALTKNGVKAGRLGHGNVHVRHDIRINPAYRHMARQALERVQHLQSVG